MKQISFCITCMNRLKHLQETLEKNILDKLTGDGIMRKLTGQQIVDKINTVSGNIAFTKFVDCQASAGKTT